MKQEFTNRLEKCTGKECVQCSCGADMKPGKAVKLEVTINGSLYNKEAEQYYFYFLENKAS